MSENDRTTIPHADACIDWTKPGAPGVTAESFEASAEVPAYFSLSFRDGAGRASRRLFTLYVDAAHGERLAERLEAAADVLRSRRLDGVRPGGRVCTTDDVKPEPTCDCVDALAHATGGCATRNPTRNNSEEADRDDA